MRVLLGFFLGRIVREHFGRDYQIGLAVTLFVLAACIPLVWLALHGPRRTPPGKP